MIEPGEHYINVDGIETFVRVAGQGPLVFIVHGGPGFSHDYLVEPLEFLQKTRKLVFYDQPGCGKTKSSDLPLTPNHIYSHFDAFVRLVVHSADVDILAHSWGSLVAMGALAQHSYAHSAHSPCLNFSNGLFVNPIPPTSTNFNLARANIASRMPATLLKEIEDAALSDDEGAQIMKLILPYYYTDPANQPDRPFELRKQTYLSLNHQLSEFDFSNQLNQIANVSILIGENDFTTLEHIDDLVSNGRKLYVIEDSTHFSFIEKPHEFRRVANEIFK